MPLPQDRYVLYDPQMHAVIPDPQSPHLPFTESRRSDALLYAGFEAQDRGHDVLVVDRMAHHGQTERWRVSPTGEVTPHSQSP